MYLRLKKEIPTTNPNATISSRRIPIPILSLKLSFGGDLLRTNGMTLTLSVDLTLVSEGVVAIIIPDGLELSNVFLNQEEINYKVTLLSEL